MKYMLPHLQKILLHIKNCLGIFCLLYAAYFLLKKGGNIVYSTCTLNKKENEKQIEKFMTKYPDMKKRKELTILPYQYHSDGFYMCLLEKE